MAALLVSAAGLTVAARSVIDVFRVSDPVLECLEEIDLGERERGEIVVARFRVGNAGRGPLTLDRFHTTCSCASVERESDGNGGPVRTLTLRPGEWADLSARVAVGVPQGERQVVGVYFQTTDPQRPQHMIEVVIPRVKGGVYMVPKAVLFGPVPVGQAATQSVELYDTGVRGRAVERVVIRQPARFAVRFVPLRPNEPSTVHPSAGRLFGRLEVPANTGRPGQLDGEVEVHLANEQRPPVVPPPPGSRWTGAGRRSGHRRS